MSATAFKTEPLVQYEAPSWVHRSRWGYHNCDKETFLEIKELHRYALHDLRATLRNERWHAKMEHNRQGPEPKCSGTTREYYAWVLLEYQYARNPYWAPTVVQPLRLPLKWRSDLKELREFHGDIRSR